MTPTPKRLLSSVHSKGRAQAQARTDHATRADAVIKTGMLRRLGMTAGLLLTLVAGASKGAAPAGQYATSGDCDGFPRTDLKAAPGLCVGLVGTHLGFARGVVALGRMFTWPIWAAGARNMGASFGCRCPARGPGA